jgi:hypothetical protein
MTTEVRFVPRSFVAPVGDPLSAEHQAVDAWVEAAFRSPGGRLYGEVDIKAVPEGRVLLDGGPAQGRRYVLAALAQVRHWDDLIERVRAGADEIHRFNSHLLPGWEDTWGRRRQAAAVVATLMRRTLPLERGDLLALLAWVNDSRTHVSRYVAPVVQIVRALERHVAAAGGCTDEELREAIGAFAARLRESYGKDEKRLATELERLCAGASPAVEQDDAPSDGARRPTPAPAPAGNPAVLTQLKRALDIPTAADDAPAAARVVGDDRFSLREDSRLAAEHELLTGLISEGLGQPGYHNPSMHSASGMAILRLSRAGQGRALLAAMERHVAAMVSEGRDLSAPRYWQAQCAAAGAVNALAGLDPDFDRAGCFDFLLYLSVRASAEIPHFARLRYRVLDGIESDVAAGSPLTGGERYVLHLLRASLIGGPPLGTTSPQVERLTRLIGDAARFYLAPGEAWADAVNAEVTAMKPARREAWAALLRHAAGAIAARPSAAWLKAAAKPVRDVGDRDVRAALGRWLALVPAGRSLWRMGGYVGDSRSQADTLHEENATILRGLLWLLPRLKSASELARLVSAVATSAYRKVPGVGPRAVKVGNSAVYALSQIPSPEAVGHLAVLKTRVKFGTAQKEIEKAFDTAAAALGLPREEIEELGVPTYGLEEVGARRERFGDYTADLRVNGRDVTLTWTRAADGKAVKSVPAKVKADHKDDLRDLQGSVKDIAGMLPAQAERIDALFLARMTWPVGPWRERYLDHPLVGTVGRRLLWTFDDPGEPKRSGAFLGGAIVDAGGRPVHVGEATRVGLWHPIGRPTEEVLAWRAWLEAHGVRQPFKQAHREVYVLTDAERRTHTYSNRFAGHVLRQHQFNALCAARGWKNRLRLMVDDTYPPASRDLPVWGLRAEYWVEGAGDDYGTDTLESGAYVRVATDQVRFYRTGAAGNSAHAAGGGYETAAAGPGDGGVNEPVPLDRVPTLVLSEVMRDVDLFVGVASVGNDPTWQDGGPGGRYRTYWQSYSLGELSETARTRKAVLETLLPRLTKLRDKWQLTERFLRINGQIRTYKIHLGSGNILMEPNDQYLCIVPSRPAPDALGPVYLPFEGDQTLSVILSKAFLLAEDSKITDPTITRQIKS